MAITSNESGRDNAGVGFAKETLSTTENRLSESAFSALSLGAEQTFKRENERKEQAATNLLPGLQIDDFGRNSNSAALIKADNPLERPGYQPGEKPKFDSRDSVGSKFMPAEKSPTATIYFYDGSRSTIPMPPAKPGQLVEFYMPRQPEGGFVVTATAGDKAWILKKNEWKEWRK